MSCINLWMQYTDLNPITVENFPVIFLKKINKIKRSRTASLDLKMAVIDTILKCIRWIARPPKYMFRHQNHVFMTFTNWDANKYILSIFQYPRPIVTDGTQLFYWIFRLGNVHYLCRGGGEGKEFHPSHGGSWKFWGWSEGGGGGHTSLTLPRVAMFCVTLYEEIYGPHSMNRPACKNSSIKILLQLV